MKLDLYKFIFDIKNIKFIQFLKYNYKINKSIINS